MATNQSQEAIFKPRNFIIKDVYLNWMKLNQSVAPFGTEQYEGQIATDDDKLAAELVANHVPMKHGPTFAEDNMWICSLKRKKFKANGEENGKVRVVDSAREPVDGATVGNGSKGNVIVFQYAYDTAGRKGIANSLTAIQVTDLIEYTGSNSVDFDMLEPIAPTKTKIGYDSVSISTAEVITDDMF